MITLPKDLVRPAEKAGIKVPVKLSDFDADEFPHWFLYCAMQLDSPMPYKNSHWENAELIATLTVEETNSLTWDQMLEKGFQVGFPKVFNKKR